MPLGVMSGTPRYSACAIYSSLVTNGCLARISMATNANTSNAMRGVLWAVRRLVQLPNFAAHSRGDSASTARNVPADRKNPLVRFANVRFDRVLVRGMRLDLISSLMG